jgi:UDP-3-O-[3-hydroxymyristoyl] glucosamine N-acyltransferase
MIKITAGEVSKILNGIVVGDPNTIITHVDKIEEATSGSICFFGNPKYESYVYETAASVLIVPKDFVPAKEIKPVLIQVEQVYVAVSTLFEVFGQQSDSQEVGISTLSSIDKNATIGKDVFIDDFVKICEGAIIGDKTKIYANSYVGKNSVLGSNNVLMPGVKIYHDCRIGNDCLFHSNVVIGSDGFGFAPQNDGVFKKIPQLGNVIIENNVEIGSNSTVDRASMGSTIIHNGVKLDNLVQIAHNVEIGENTVMASQSGIAGSAKVGKNCMIGGQVGIIGHITIADGTKIQGQSGVNASISTPNTAIWGTPSIGYMDYLKSFAVFKKLPQMAKDLDNLLKDKLKE